MSANLNCKLSFISCDELAETQTEYWELKRKQPQLSYKEQIMSVFVLLERETDTRLIEKLSKHSLNEHFYMFYHDFFFLNLLITKYLKF